MGKLILVLFFWCAAGFAQKVAQFIQYMNNTVGINQAYAGSRGAISYFVLYHVQWIGLKGTSETSSFSLKTKETSLLFFHF